MKHLFLCIVISVMAIGCSHGIKNESNILYGISKNNNLFEIYEKEKLSFTFNVQLPDKTVKRDWEWNIKSNQIFLNGTLQNEITDKFINDIYWLLFPLKAYEDSGQYELIINRNIQSPLSNIECSEIIIKYISGKGYTPNDTYKLYVDNKLKIIEWSYLKSGLEPPKRITAWKEYKSINGITLSLLREGTGNFKVWFTNVSIE